ncbi:MAG: HAD family hydrolase [Deltaproteobacteria bacterium]|nr:HAD family hydrolase [Deltaproteobacteria bacterium]
MIHPLLKEVKAFLFDFDGTLAELQLDFPALRREILLLAAGRFGLPDPAAPHPAYLLELTEALRNQLAVEDPEKADRFFDRAMALIVEKEQEAAHPENLFPWTKKVLDFLIRADYRVAVLTRNSGLAVRRVFPDLDRYCHLFLPREAVAKPKPDPDHVRSAVRKLGVECHQAVMVGDHPLDIRCGRQTGLVTLGVLTGRTTAAEMAAARADLILPDVGALLDLFYP